MFTIYSADVTGNPGNCSYPHKTVVLDEASLKTAISHDYVCAEYKNNYRNGDNFIGSDCMTKVIFKKMSLENNIKFIKDIFNETDDELLSVYTFTINLFPELKDISNSMSLEERDRLIESVVTNYYDNNSLNIEWFKTCKIAPANPNVATIGFPYASPNIPIPIPIPIIPIFSIL